ncbi:MAG: hypothetical protein KBE09_05050 [Candidatus Pacebacteria bacterium]|nr:hypothetical protein [Candidatus Paceibacterota bacterium]
MNKEETKATIAQHMQGHIAWAQAATWSALYWLMGQKRGGVHIGKVPHAIRLLSVTVPISALVVWLTHS